MNTDRDEKTRECIELLEGFIESAKSAHFICDRIGTFIGGNNALWKLTGYSREEYVDQNILTLGLMYPDHVSGVLEMFDDVFEYGSAGPAVVMLQRKEGSLLDVEAEMRVVTVKGSRFLIGTLRPVPYQQMKLNDSIEEAIGVQKFLDLAQIMVVSLDTDGNISLVNENACRILGYEEDQIIGRNWFDGYLPQKTREQTREVFEKLMAGDNESAGQNINLVLTRTGQEVLVEWHNTILKDPEGNITGVLGIGEDITERERSNHVQKSILRVLENINQATSSNDLIKHSLLLVKDLAECEAAGIRLRETGEYPYIVASGFATRFVAGERDSCIHGLKSGAAGTSDDAPFLDCICGKVISGKTDPDRPIFTRAGSFWTNSTSELISTAGQTETGFSIGGHCPAEGYESMALIPLHSNGEMLGLIQLNDHRTGRFNPDMIALLEGIADSIGAALGKLLIEEALRESEEKYRAIVDNIGIGISLINPRMELLSINNQMKTWFPDIDISDKPVCHKKYGDPAQDTPCANCPTIKTLEDGMVHETISSIQHGSVLKSFRVVSSPVKNKEGRIVGAIELLEDFSDKIMMERALDEKLRFESLVSNISSRFINIHLDHVDSAINEGLRSIAEFLEADHIALMSTGKEPGEFQQMHLWSSNRLPAAAPLSGTGMSVRLPNMSSELLERGRFAFTRPEDVPVGWPEESRILVEENSLSAVIAVPLANAGGSQILIMIGSADERPQWIGNTVLRLRFIGEILVSAINRKMVDEQLRDAMEEAEAANRGKSQFLANMSHEIRTPLNSIIGFTDLVQETNLSTDQLDYVSTIKTSGEMLLSLLNDILDFSKIEANELVLEETEFELDRLADDVCKMTCLRIGSKPIEVSKNLDENIPHCTIGDPVRLRQVVTNLMDNAAKFTESGRIELTLRTEKETVDRVMMHGAVTDSGIGIPPEHLDTVFDLFQQGDKSMTRRFGGTGLGLSICRQIVQLMDGEIWVVSEFGSGSSFHFTFWLKKATTSRRECLQNNVNERMNEGAYGPGEESERRSGPSATTRILLVEDNPVNLKLAKLMLTRENCHIEIACNGQEAVDKYVSAPDQIDLILMDVQMPVMDGIAAAREIRARGHKTIPIIAMTAHAIKGDRERCLEAGMNDYVTKPIRKNRVLEVISKWVTGKELV